MGLLSSRQAPSPNAEHVLPAHSYKFPPKSGPYFGTHFMMGGERFESTQPEMYLFGDNSDLNFLGPKPVTFPYVQPPSSEPTRTLQCLTAIRRDSLKFVKTSSDQKRMQKSREDKLLNPSNNNVGENSARPHSVQVDLTNFDESQYSIEFIFDCDAPCSITIYFFATEEIGPDGLRYSSKRPELTSPTYQYEIGANQVFSHPEHIFDPCVYRTDELMYNTETEVIPIVIHCVSESQDNGSGPQSHSTLAVVEKSAEGHGFILKPLKQKIYVDGGCYLLQEIYGIENKHATISTGGGQVSSNAGTGEQRQESTCETSSEESGTECVVCMSELRDTLILPCRHLCLCSGCAETLRYKASCCPICRAPFRALLQIKTLRRIRCGFGPVGPIVGGHNGDQAAMESSAVAFLNRYETVPLIEALNGPMEAVTVMLPINPIPPAAQMAATSSATTGQPASVRSGTNGQQKRTKNKKVRAAAAIQEVLTPQALVQPAAPELSPEEDEDPPVFQQPLGTTENNSLSSFKVSPRPKTRTSIQHPLCEDLLPGQMDGNDANSDDDYVEAHSVSCGEVVTKPELEGPHASDDESEITFDGAGSTYYNVAVLDGQDARKIQTGDNMDNVLDSATAVVNPRLGTNGTDTPNSNNSVSSVASAHSSQPLLTGQQKSKDAADRI